MTGWWRQWRQWRERRVLARRPIPDVLWQSTLTQFAFLAQRSEADAKQLRNLSTLFLSDKEFSGANGCVVTDAMAVAIAAQACLPVLQLGLDHYAGVKGIVVHDGPVLARRVVEDDMGIVHAYREELAGEWMEGGPIMLSWGDVQQAGQPGFEAYNVVIHEFAHVLDLRNGLADGVPALASRAEHSAWRAVLQTEWQTHCSRVEHDLPTLLDPYATEGIDEFFAVSSEAFFMAPAALANEHAPLFALLSSYYRQDPRH